MYTDYFQNNNHDFIKSCLSCIEHSIQNEIKEKLLNLELDKLTCCTRCHLAILNHEYNNDRSLVCASCNPISSDSKLVKTNSQRNEAKCERLQMLATNLNAINEQLGLLTQNKHLALNIANDLRTVYGLLIQKNENLQKEVNILKSEAERLKYEKQELENRLTTSRKGEVKDLFARANVSTVEQNPIVVVSKATTSDTDVIIDEFIVPRTGENPEDVDIIGGHGEKTPLPSNIILPSNIDYDEDNYEWDEGSAIETDMYSDDYNSNYELECFCEIGD